MFTDVRRNRKPARSRIQRPTQPPSLNDFNQFRSNNCHDHYSDSDISYFDNRMKFGVNKFNYSSDRSSSPIRNFDNEHKLSHAILSSSPLGPKDASDPRKRVWKERFRRNQLARSKRARMENIENSRKNSSNLFNLNEEDEDTNNNDNDDVLTNRIIDKMTERDYQKFKRREELKFNLEFGSDFDPLEFWNENDDDNDDEVDIDEHELNLIDDNINDNINDNNDELDMNDDELNAIYDQWLLQQTQQNNNNSNNNESMDLS